MAYACFIGLHGIQFRYHSRVLGRSKRADAINARHARAMGVPPGKEQNPEESVKAAVKYIAATDRSLSMIPDKQERLSFILASYNAGLGHIYDAMALAEKYGKNKLVWKDNVENFILLKSNEEYFTDPISKKGYFPALETYN